MIVILEIVFGHSIRREAKFRLVVWQVDFDHK